MHESVRKYSRSILRDADISRLTVEPRFLFLKMKLNSKWRVRLCVKAFIYTIPVQVGVVSSNQLSVMFVHLHVVARGDKKTNAFMAPPQSEALLYLCLIEEKLP